MMHDVISLISKRKVGTLDTERYLLRTTDRRLRALWSDMEKHGISVDLPADGPMQGEKVRVVPLIGHLAAAMFRLRREGFAFQVPSDHASQRSGAASEAARSTGSSRPSHAAASRTT